MKCKYCNENVYEIIDGGQKVIVELRKACEYFRNRFVLHSCDISEESFEIIKKKYKIKI